MGEGTAGLNQDSPRETTRQLEGEISRLREELGELVGELDRRRHELLDVKLQVKRHALAATLTGVSLVAAASGLVWLGIWHAQRRQGAVRTRGPTVCARPSPGWSTGRSAWPPRRPSPPASSREC
jgi:hypothetical protein